MSNTVIIGTAVDGPANKVWKPSSLQELYSVYGGMFYEEQVVSPTATSLTLEYTAYDQVSDKILGDYVADYLYNSQASQDVVTFGPIGGTGTYTTVLQYRPYLGKSDLITAAQNYYNQTGQFPYVARIGGTHSTLASGDWSFKSIHPGKAYNDIEIAIADSTITITDSKFRFGRVTYNFSSYSDLKERLSTDAAKGVCPVTLLSYPASSTNATGTLSNGSDTVDLDQNLEDLFATEKLPYESPYVLILYPTTEDTPQLIERITSYTFPRMFFAPIPSATGSAPVVDLENELASYSYTHNLLTYVYGHSLHNIAGKAVWRYAAESVVAALSKASQPKLTNLNINAEAYEPVLNQPDLDVVLDLGVCALTRRILNDICIYASTNSSKQSPYLKHLRVAESWSIIATITEPYLGTKISVGRKPDIEQLIRQAITSLGLIDVEEVFVEVYDNFVTTPSTRIGESYNYVTKVMDVNVSIRVFEEILDISFQTRINA